MRVEFLSDLCSSHFLCSWRRNEHLTASDGTTDQWVCLDKDGGKLAKVFPLIIARTVQTVSPEFERAVLLTRATSLEVHRWDASKIMKGQLDMKSFNFFPIQGNKKLQNWRISSLSIHECWIATLHRKLNRNDPYGNLQYYNLKKFNTDAFWEIKCLSVCLSIYLSIRHSNFTFLVLWISLNFN